jgi:hypothetical protein
MVDVYDVIDKLKLLPSDLTYTPSQMAKFIESQWGAKAEVK